MGLTGEGRLPVLHEGEFARSLTPPQEPGDGVARTLTRPARQAPGSTMARRDHPDHALVT